MARKRKPEEQAAEGGQDTGTLWTKDEDGHVRPVRVKIGPSDGVNTEIFSDLPEARLVVVGEDHSGQAAGNANPFAPQLFSKKQ